MSPAINHVIGLVGVAVMWAGIIRCLVLIARDRRRRLRRPIAPLEQLDLHETAARRRRRRAA